MMGRERLEELGHEINERSARVGVIGLPRAAEFAKARFHVTGFDVDRENAHAIQQGESHIGEVFRDDLRVMRESPGLDQGRKKVEE
ncbi:MAG: hypothetical protein VCC04_11380 [Myxococcota bacterium]